MLKKPLVLRSWPQAILHMDADAFFVGVEQAIHPELKGKPVITGAERGIVTAASYEAKAYGVQRGVSLTEAVHLCPDLIMVPSDFEQYSIYSKRMFSILRRYTPDVEEYSIDEAFADLSGLRRLHRSGYIEIARSIQTAIENELDLSVSVGVSLSKSLAKLCSKFRKPHGITAVPGNMIHLLLERTRLEQVWGFGPNTVALLRKHGIKTALDFVTKPRYLADQLLGKIGTDIWDELRGEYIQKICTAPKTDYYSISKTRTFSPTSTDRQHIFARLLRNLESACAKARHYNLSARSIRVMLRSQDFKRYHEEVSITQPTNAALDLTPIVRKLFTDVFKDGTRYRATGVILNGLQPSRPTQFSLFDDPIRSIKTDMVGHATDQINQRFGKQTLYLSEGMELRENKTKQQHNQRLRLRIPFSPRHVQ